MSENPNEAPAVLDLAQLRRIQGLHGGLLYQHLYAVCCYLAAPTTGVLRVRVERDEDVEVILEGRTVYVQLKYYSDPLSPSDLKGVVERFNDLRDAHRSGARDGDAVFAILATAGLGKTLAETDWPDDVSIVTPDSTVAALEGTGLLVPPATDEELFRMAQDLAEGYRLSALRPASLVSKLLGVVARAAAGRGKTTFEAAAIEEFCELVCAQLQPLPHVDDYFPQEGEPTLPDERTNGFIVVGHGGYGKSAWAAHVASLSSEIVAYVVCSPSSGEDICARIVMTAASTLAASKKVRAHEVLLPGRNGVEALALLSSVLEHRAIALTVVLDDCHRVPADSLIAALQSGRSMRWCLVGRPSPTLVETAARSGLEVHTLAGWDDDTIARVLSGAGARTAPDTVSRLRELTGGAPLFVLRAAAEIARIGGDTGAYCQDVSQGGGATESVQAHILEQTVASLDRDDIRVAAALAGVDLGFSIGDWSEILAEPLDLPKRGVARVLRGLLARQIGTETVHNWVSVHDAFRPLLQGRGISGSESRAVLQSVAQALRTRLSQEGSLEPLVPLIRVLAQLGEMSQLADVANAMSDWIRETASRSEVKSYVELAISDGSLSDEDRFWALDTVAFFEIESGSIQVAAEHLAEMEVLAANMGPGHQGPVLHKRLLLAMTRGDLKAVRSIVSAASEHPSYELVLLYHGAIAEGKHGNVDDAIESLLKLTSRYLGILGLSARQVFGASTPEITAMMKRGASSDDLHRLADCCDAIAKLGRGSQRHRGVAALHTIWAVKFFDMAGAHRSALLSAQDMLDVMLRDLDDPHEALRWMQDHVLPAAQRAKLPDILIPIRAQHAVLLAQCGEFDSAQREFEKLDPYVGSLSPHGKGEIMNQKRLVAALADKGPPSLEEVRDRSTRLFEQHQMAERLRAQLGKAPTTTPVAAVRAQKVGRNQPCSCGSTKKYKKCCGDPKS